MRSRAHIKTHPLHPILIPFPIAFFTGTLVFDLLALGSEQTSFQATAHNLLIGGIITAVLAAVPGFVDFLQTVPPRSSASKRAATHAILNLCMLALFIFALVIRDGDEFDPTPLVVSLEIAGVALMMVAGWMGGTLVHRNQIGVDPRYAFAGKWKEEYHATPENGRLALGPLNDLKRDQMKLLHVGEQRIVVARTEDGVFAFDDHCSHRGGSLAGGMVICSTVQCPWHGSQFSVRTGDVKAGPATQNIRTYPIEIIGDIHYLSIGN